MGKKLGLGWSRALPVMRQKDDILIQKFTVAGVDIVCQVLLMVSHGPRPVWSRPANTFYCRLSPPTALSSPRLRLRRGRDKNDPNLCGGREAPLHERKRKHLSVCNDICK